VNAVLSSTPIVKLHRSGWTSLLATTFFGCTARPANQPEIAPVSGTVTMDSGPPRYGHERRHRQLAVRRVGGHVARQPASERV